MSTEKKKYYPELDAKVSFPEKEEEVLKFWEKDGTFKKSISQRDGRDEYVFYDGPPFANGLPHYGHLVTGYVKDIIPRFQTMRGGSDGTVTGYRPNWMRKRHWAFPDANRFWSTALKNTTLSVKVAC